MALLTAAELKASREAVQAEVDTVSDAVAEEAIEEATLALYEILGYDVEHTGTSITLRSTRSDVLRLPQRARTVTAVTQDDATVDADAYYILPNRFALKRPYGWYRDAEIVVTGTFGYTSSDAQWKLAKKWVRIAAVDYLSQTSETSSSGGYMGEMESYSAEGASFRFSGDATARGDLSRLALQIGLHPYTRKPKGMTSVRLRSSAYGL